MEIQLVTGLGLEDTALGLLTALSFAVDMALNPAGGILSDRVGRKRTGTLSLAVLSAGCVRPAGATHEKRVRRKTREKLDNLKVQNL